MATAEEDETRFNGSGGLVTLGDYAPGEGDEGYHGSTSMEGAAKVLLEWRGDVL